MKTLLILLSIMTILPVIGMFYWMYKSKNGELKLSENDWHVKLKAYMWDFETWQAKNACPYYWGLVFSILILPIYLLGREGVYLYSYLAYKFPKIDKPKFKFKINLIPETKKEMYNKIYRNSKKWLFNGLISIIILITIFLLFKMFQSDWKFFIVFITVLSIISLHIIFLILENEYFIEYYWQYMTMIGVGLFNIVKLPFLLAYKALKYPAKYIFKIYTNNCPPITWVK